MTTASVIISPVEEGNEGATTHPSRDCGDDRDVDAELQSQSPNPAKSDKNIDIPTLTKAWIAKSKDLNATTEERERARQLVEEFGIGDTKLVQ
jgi:hypothetical protein